MMAFDVLLLHSPFFFFFLLLLSRFSSHAITINIYIYKILGDVDDDGNNTTTTNLLALHKLLFFSRSPFFPSLALCDANNLSFSFITTYFIEYIHYEQEKENV